MKKDCESVQSELSAYIDNELPPATRTIVETHLNGCPHCQQELQKLKTLVAGVAALPRLQPAPQFLAEVRRKIARQQKPQWTVWQDYLFRPVWLKVPLEAAVVIVIVALMARFEHPPREPAPKYAAKQKVGETAAAASTASESQSVDKLAANRSLAGAAVERSPMPMLAAPAVPAPSKSTAELQAEMPVVTVLVRAKDFNEVQNRAQQFAASMNGRVVPPSGRETAAQTFLVELPQEKVESFRSQLLQATGQTRATGSLALADESTVAGKTAPRSAATTGIGRVMLTGKAETNLTAMGGSERLGAVAEPKAPTAVLEIQVVPPAN